MASLKYFDGAQPGKKRKMNETERKENKKQYEKHRPSRKFSENWRKGREWLVYDDEKPIDFVSFTLHANKVGGVCFCFF